MVATTRSTYLHLDPGRVEDVALYSGTVEVGDITNPSFNLLRGKYWFPDRYQSVNVGVDTGAVVGDII